MIFTSDHGYHLGEHDFWQKMSLHEESTRIPLIVAVPGQAPGTSDALVQQIDLYPTLADLAGLAIPEHVQGKSFAPVIANPQVRIHSAVYCLRGKDHLLRTENLAYIRYQDGSEELYDMRTDPDQFTNRVGDAMYVKSLEMMQLLLTEKLTEIEAGTLPVR